MSCSEPSDVADAASPQSARRSAGTSQLQLLLDCLPDFAIFMLDPEGRIVTWNAGAERLKGYAAEDILGRHFSCLYLPEDVRANRPGLALETATREGRFEEEAMRIRSDGQPFRAHVTLTAVRNADGALIGFGKVTRDVTAQWHAEQARRGLRERLLRAIRGTGCALFEGVDVTRSEALWVSPDWWALLGYDPREMPETVSGEAIEEMIHPEDRAAVRQARLESVRAGAPMSVEHRIRTRSGDWLWVQIRSQAECDPEGKLVRVSGSMQDMSARKRVEVELLRTNERFAIASRAAGFGFWDFDVSSNTLRWDDQLFRLYGRSRRPGEQSYALWADTLHPQDRARVLEGVVQALRSGESFEMSFRIRRPDGELRHLKAAGTVTRDPGGRAVRMTGVNVDVTEHEHLTTALQQARTDLQAILDNVPARITAWDAQMNNLFMNRAAETQFGVTARQARGRHLREIIGAERFQRSESRVQAALAGQRQWRDSVDQQTDGTRRYSRISFVPKILDGQAAGMYVLATDVTDLRRSYERIRELLQRLESIREEERRSLALMLHEGIAQDLAAAKMSLDRARRAPETQDIDRLCFDLSQSLRQCIEDLRRGANELRPWTLAHLSLFESIQEQARQFAEVSGLVVDVSCETALPEIGERTRLLFFRAAQEAMTNVARHARAERVTIVLNATADSVQMDICDDGIGISAEALDKTGSFGLLGVKERLKSLGGSLVVRRAAERGTRLSVRCPIPELARG